MTESWMTRARCVGRVEWVSEDPARRAWAAAECDACPVQGECAAHAIDIDACAGVFAGTDCTYCATCGARKNGLPRLECSACRRRRRRAEVAA